MNRQSYSDYLFNKRIKKDYENSDVINYKDLNIKNKETYFYDELKDINVKGFPFASDFANKNGDAIDYEKYSSLNNEEKAEYRLRYHYLPYMHELYIGTTGSGKTTTCIEPQLRAISSQKNKPNIFITDPKGEIFLHNAKHLKDQGYKIQVINFKNTEFSNTWNPLEEIYLTQMEIKDVGKDAILRKGEVDEKLKLVTDKFKYLPAGYFEYKGMAFPNVESLNEYFDNEKYFIHAKVSSMVNQITSQMFPDDKSTSDPMWTNGSRGFIAGIMLALLDDALNPSKNFTKEKFNIKTINDVYTLAARCSGEKGKTGKLREFTEGKPKEALDKMEAVTDTADITRKSFLAVCQAMIGNWMNGHIFSLTSSTNISLDDSENPLALFVITRDYDKSDNIIAGLFLNWVYTKFLEKAEKEERVNGVSSSRPIHFMLDEFANIPPIPDFEIKIATSRSRNMWFHIFLQSYEQLDAVYKKDIATIIIDNCNQQTFLGSQSVKSKERFSKECGKKTVKSLQSQISGSIEDISVVNSISLSDLNCIKPGWMYVKRIKTDVIESTYVRSYQCANEGIFKDFHNSKFEDYAPLNITNPNNPKYLYKNVIPDEFLKPMFGSEEYLSFERKDKDDGSKIIFLRGDDLDSL